MEQYQKFGTINRTVNRPVLRVRPYFPVDWQALPPRGWCVCCRAEVYRAGQERCDRCRRKELRMES